MTFLLGFMGAAFAFAAVAIVALNYKSINQWTLGRMDALRAKIACWMGK